jgi:hypothetical protein
VCEVMKPVALEAWERAFEFEDQEREQEIE